MKKLMSFCAIGVVGALCVMAMEASANQIRWNGASGDGKWSTPGNWAQNAAPVDGDTVEVSGAGAVGGVISNDIPGLTLTSLTLAGSTPFKLSGESLAFESANTMLLQATATAAVTNSIAMSLPSGSNYVYTGSSPFVLEGAFSGAEAKLVLSSLDGGKITLDAANTHGRGTVCLSHNTLILARPDACPAGSLLEVRGNMYFNQPGDYNFDICCTSTTESGGYVVYTFYPVKNQSYNFYGRLYSDTLSCQLRFTNTSGVNTACTMNFYNTLCYPNAFWYGSLRESWSVNFMEPVHFNKMMGGGSYSNAAAGHYINDTNTVEILTPGNSIRFDLQCTNAFPSVPRIYIDQYCNAGTGGASGFVNLHGYDQVFDRIEHAPAQASGDYWTGRGTFRSYDGNANPILGGVITLKGTASASTSSIIYDKISIIWDPVDNFTQTFVNRDHEMTGALVVSNGTLEVGGSATFKKVGRIVVADGGRFLLNTSAANALIGVTNIEVAAGGTFEVASGATPFTAGKVIMDYATGAAFKLPAGDTYDFLGVRLDGEPMDGDTYHPGGALPGLTGGDIIARDFPVVITDATWSGGATPDDSIATPGNWTGGSKPALTGGGLRATFGDGGARADIDQNVDWAGVTFNRNFTLDGSGVLTLRTSGITTGANCTNDVNATIRLRGDQTWNVGSNGRLNVNTGLTDAFGSSAVTKTGAGALYLNAPSSSMGPFTLGSKSANGGTVYINTSTNAFGPASDCPVLINSINNSSPAQGVARFLTSTVVERPITFDGENAYYNFYVEAGTVRFTRKFTQVGAMRLHFNKDVHVICEGGASLGGWTCFHGDKSAKWTFRGETPITANYFYIANSQNVILETPSNTVSAIDLLSAGSFTATQPHVLNTITNRVFLRDSGARFIVAGDQQIGGFMNMDGGTITSAVPSTVYFYQYDYNYVASPKDKPMTNSAVRIDGAVTLYKRGPSLFVQDCAAATTGGIGVGEGTLRLTAAAKFPNATRFFAEGTARAEIGGERCLGRKVEVYYDDTATVKLDGDQRVAALYINGVRQKPGNYGSSASGAENVLAGFEGTGRLIVGPHGFILTFR